MLRLGLILCAFAYIGCYYIPDTVIRQHVYFVGHAIGLLLISNSWKGNDIWRNIMTGFAVGRLFDEIYFFVLGNEETQLSYSIALLFAFPIVGYFWRNYREKTSIAFAVTGMSYLLKWVATKIILMLDSIF